jgi:oligopeptide/dipeptide ABC transporter ATP-binding protein
MSKLLSVKNLRTCFQTVDGLASAVDGISFDIQKGKTMAIVGESGCGKTVTALSLIRLIQGPAGRIESGEILYEGQDLLKLPEKEMREVRGNKISMIFQEPMTSLNPVTRVGQQVVEAIRLHESLPKAEAWKRTRDLFGQVGIPDPEQRLEAYPHQLSGGLKQRVMVAMALSTRPKLLIADEPTTALDVTIQAQILDLLRDLQRRSDMAILLITHNLGIVNELADHVAVMYAGRIVETAPRVSLLSHARHPYTRGLLRAMPAFAAKGEPLAEIAGVVPSPGSWPAGCRFAGRCGEVFDPCSLRIPHAIGVGKEHSVHCHAVERDGPGVES